MFPFRRKRSRRRQPPKPRWLKWLLFLFIGYALLMMAVPGTVQKNFQKAQQEISKNPMVNIDQYKEKIFPEQGAGLRINDTEEGAGAPAVCGQRVAVAYKSYLAQGNELPDAASADKPLTFTIGDGKVMPVFDKGVIGMKKSGKRSVIAPPLMSYGLEDYKRNDVPEGATVRFEMELLSVEPALPDVNIMPYRIAEVAIGRGDMLVCGNTARLRIKIWDTEGKLILEKPEITITPGKSEAMIGLEQGVIGMVQGGVRLLIVPPPYQATMSGAPAKVDLPLPKGQTLLVEATLLPAAQPAP